MIVNEPNYRKAEGKVSPGELVKLYGTYLETPPNGWNSKKRSENEIEHKAVGIQFNLSFLENGREYHLKVRKILEGKENKSFEELYGEVPYSEKDKPNLERLFKENMEFARKKFFGEER